MNIISKKITIKLGLTITEEYKIYIIDINENVSKTKKFYENIKVSINKVSITQCFLVMANFNKFLILKIFFAQATKLRSKNKKNKKI